MQKICKECSASKDASEFYPTQGECKVCTRARTKKYRLDNIDRVMEYDRNRPNSRERTIKQSVSVKLKRQDDEYRLKANKVKKDWRIRNPLRAKALNAVNNAVRDKTLTRLPCEICGEIKAQGHHDDYTKPLDVRWLCVTHHAAHHKTERELVRRAL